MRFEGSGSVKSWLLLLVVCCDKLGRKCKIGIALGCELWFSGF